MPALYFNRVSLAYQYWLADNMAGSRRILDDCPLDRRGWEWRYLDRMHHADLLTLPGNGQFTTSLKFSSDGKRMAAFTQSGGAGVRIWDLTANKPLADIEQLRQYRPFTCGDLRADGKLLALGDHSGAISFWDAETGQLTREFARLPKSVGSLSFSPDGKWLASARAENRNGERLLPLTEPPRNEELVVWDAASAEEVFHPKGHGFTVQFSPDGSRLLTFKINTAQRISPLIPETFLALFETTGWAEVDTGKLGNVSSYSFSDDGKRLAVGGFDRQRNAHFARIIYPANGNELSNLTHSRPDGDIALSRDGAWLAVASPLGSTPIDVWDVKQKRIVHTLRGHINGVKAVTFVPDGRLASCSWTTRSNSGTLQQDSRSPEFPLKSVLPTRSCLPARVCSRPVAKCWHWDSVIRSICSRDRCGP